ncbi:MAG: hypothetical protein RSD22_06155 [Romboutsia sp.]
MIKSRFVKKVTTAVLCCILTMGVVINTEIAFADEKYSENEKSLLNEVLDLNDENWNTMLAEVNPTEKGVQKDDVYFKIVEEKDNSYIEPREYTAKEYLVEKSRMERSRAIDNTTNWLKITYEMYPIWGNKFSVLVGFEWQRAPSFQKDDKFLIGSDSNSVLPGSNNRVNFTYWPNTNAKTVVNTYNSLDNRSKFQFSGGAVGVDFDIVSSDFYSKIYATSNYQNYFKFYDTACFTQGSPRGVLGFTSDFSGSSTVTSIGVTYAHKQMVIGEPSISVDAAGGVNLGGSASLGYDQAKTSIKYFKNSIIE